MHLIQPVLETLHGLPVAATAVPAGVLLSALVVSAAVRVYRLRGFSPEQRARQARDWFAARGSFVIGGAPIAVASIGVMTWMTSLGLPVWLAVLGSVSIEGLILYFKVEEYRAIHDKRSPALARSLSWLFVGISAWANLTHPLGAPGPAGALVFGAFPVAGGVVLEFKAWTTKRETRGGDRAGTATRLARAMWHRAWSMLAARLGVDVHATGTQVERELRIAKAGRLMFALQTADASGADRRARRLERRAQRAREQAGIPADAQAHLAVLRHMRMLAATRSEARDAAPFEPFTPRFTDPIRDADPPAVREPANRGRPRLADPGHSNGDRHRQGSAASATKGVGTAGLVRAAHEMTPEASHQELADRLGLSRSTVKRNRPEAQANGHGQPAFQR